MLTPEELKNFLDENVNEKTFPLFAALINLKNPLNYQTVIELLQQKRLNFFDIFNLPLIDDIAIEELLTVKEKYLSPTYVSNTDKINTSNTYTYLMKNTLLSKFFEDYTTYINFQFNNNLLNSLYPVSSYSTLHKKNIYKNDEDFENSFKNNVVIALLEENKVTNVSELFPKLLLAKELPVNSIIFFEKIINLLFKNITENFNNEKLSSLFVLTGTHSSIVLDDYSFFNDLLNIIPYSPSTNKLLPIDLHNLSTRKNLIYTEKEINELWTELFNTAFDFNSGVTNTLGYIKYKIRYIQTLEEKNNLQVNKLIYNNFLLIYNFINEYIKLHKRVDELIISRLNVKIL